MRDIRKTEELIFVSHFETHSVVWHLLEIDDDIDNPTAHTRDYVRKGFAFQSRIDEKDSIGKGKRYLMHCNWFNTRKQADDFAHDGDFNEYHNTEVYVLNSF